MMTYIFVGRLRPRDREEGGEAGGKRLRVLVAPARGDLWGGRVPSGSLPAEERGKMASGTTGAGGDYDLSDPLGSFLDMVRRVVLRPAAFFAGLALVRLTPQVRIPRAGARSRQDGGVRDRPG